MILEKIGLTGRDITTMKVGGSIKKVIFVSNEEGKLLTLLNSMEGNWRLIGKGSNLLIQDAGYEGTLIVFSDESSGYISDRHLVQVSGGLSMEQLSQTFLWLHSTGAEFAKDIPGTVGGSVYMNAGAWGQDISKIFHSAKIWMDGEIKTFSKEDMKFEYRKSILHDLYNPVVFSVFFNLKEDSQDNIKSKMLDFEEKRKKTQPLLSEYPSSGTIIKRKQKEIKEKGLAGYRIGDAMISKLNPGFIVNLGNASSYQVISLINLIQSKVGGDLEVEIL